MKKSYLSLIILIFLGITGSLFAQEKQEVRIDPGNPAFQESYRNFDFKGNFAALVTHDADNNFYLVDFSKLPGKYDKVCFMNFCFGEDKIVNIDGDLSHDKIWFLANKKYTEQEVLKIFSSVREKTEKSSQLLNEEQKSVWLKANDKYK
jgi:hypothetical protein